MNDMSIKPHTRQKMKLMTMKHVKCAECQSVTRKRHVLLCFHSYCEKCFVGLAKGLMGFQTGLVCTICKTFDPFNQKEEKDDGPPVFCKIHANCRYLLNCVPCNQIMCYRCKMSDHYDHQSETVQCALDRIIPFVKRAAEEEESQNAILRKKIMENGGQISQMKEKIEKLEVFLKEESTRVETKLKKDYKKIKTMYDDPKFRRKGIHDAQREMTKYFMRVKIPFHRVEICPDEGAIAMTRLASIEHMEFDCEVGSCRPIHKYEDEEPAKCEHRRDGNCGVEACEGFSYDEDEKKSSEDDEQKYEGDDFKNENNNESDLKSKKSRNKEKKAKESNKTDSKSSENKKKTSGNPSSENTSIGPNVSFSTLKLPNKNKPEQKPEPVPLSNFPSIEKAKNQPGMENKVMKPVHTDPNVTVLQWVDKDADDATIQRERNMHADIVIINPDSSSPFAQMELVEALLRTNEPPTMRSNPSTVKITELDDNEDITKSVNKESDKQNSKNSSDKENGDLNSNQNKEQCRKKQLKNKKQQHPCKTLSKITKKSLKHKKHDKNICEFRRSCNDDDYTVKSINEDTCVATLEKDGKETTVTLLCEECEKKRKGVDDTDYSEVETALKSSTPVEIGKTKVGKEFISIRYTPTNHDATKLFDQVEIDDEGNLIDIETGHVMGDNIIGKIEILRKPYNYKKDISKYEEIHQSLIEKTYREKKKSGEPLVETCSCYDKVTLSPFKESFRNSKLDLYSLPSKSFKYNGFFCYGSPKICQRLCRNNNRVYLACYDEDKYFIMQYDAINGKLLKNGRPPTDVKKPCAMYPFNAEQLLIASDNGIHLIDKDLKLVCKLLKGSFNDVCFEGTRIAALDNYRSHVHIVDISTDPPTYESIFHVEETNHKSRSLVLRDEAVFVSTNKHNIKKYSLKGELLWQWGSFGDGGPGFLDKPNICAVDKNESLLVVDTENKRLQVVNSACKWKLLELEQMEFPSDVMVTEDGFIYVINREKCIVHWYSFDT